MSRTVFLIFGTALLALPLTMLLGILVIGCNADPPGKAETAVMTWAKHNILVHNKTQRSPIKDSAAAVADGKVAFSHYCVACHGLDGQNTGYPLPTACRHQRLRWLEKMCSPIPTGS
jgi:mono/diheme cytochrome c family protein